MSLLQKIILNMLPFQVHQHKEPFVVSGHCETEKASQVSERNACQVPQSDLENLTREGRRVTECQFLIGVQFWDKDHTAMVLKQNVPNSKCCPQGPQIAVPHGTSTRNAKGPPLMDKGPWLAAPVEVLRRCESFVHETRSFGAQIEVLCGATTQGLWGVPVETKFRTKHFEFGAFIEPFDQNLEHHSPI